MGKKSKRNKSNKSSPCYHGCTKNEFHNCGEHYKVLEDLKQISINLTDEETYKKEAAEFDKKHKRFTRDPIFGCYVIAHIADDYLKGINNVILYHRLLLFIDIRYYSAPKHEGKDIGPKSKIMTDYKKYRRDIQTERGMINCIAREIPCDCMEEKRIEAKSMAKVAVCYFCRQEFSKQIMLRCTGCDLVQYCSTECRLKAWPAHKKECSSIRTSLSPTPTPSPSVPSSFGEHIVDAEQEQEEIDDVDDDDNKNNNNNNKAVDENNDNSIDNTNTNANTNTNTNTNTNIQMSIPI